MVMAIVLLTTTNLGLTAVRDQKLPTSLQPSSCLLLQETAQAQGSFLGSTEESLSRQSLACDREEAAAGEGSGEPAKHQ